MMGKGTKCEGNLKDSPSVLAHIEILQGIIKKMSENSATCKNWTITTVMALLSLHYAKPVVPLELCYIPVALFFLQRMYIGIFAGRFFQ